MTERTAPAYRAIEPDEMGAVASMMTMSFGNPAEAGSYAERNNRPEQFRVLDDGGDLVAGVWFGRLGQWWLGRSVPSAQVLNVGVPPPHRGRGHATTLMRSLLHELHDSGVPTATLFASTAALYRGVGFEVAGQWCWYEILAEHLPRNTGAYRARQVPLEDLSEIRTLYDRVAPSRHGALDRDERWWKDRFASARHSNALPAAFVLDGPVPPEASALLGPDAGPAGGPVAWALLSFGTYDHWKSEITVRDWGCLPGAERALYGLVGGFNVLQAKVSWTGPYPDPAIFALPERRYKLEEGPDEWFLRIVDLPGALTKRPWPAGIQSQITVRVEDQVCPWNEGEWTLELADGKARVERAPAGSATATLNIRALASLFSGFLDPAALATAGLIRETDTATIAQLRTFFASPMPWTAEHY